MPAITTVTLNDSVPTARAFDPLSCTVSRSELAYDGGATAAGKDKLILTFSPANGNRATSRVGIQLNMPVEQTVDGVVGIAYTARFKGEFILPQQMTDLERADLVAFVANALDNASIKGYVTDEAPFY